MNSTHALLPFGDLQEKAVEQTPTHLRLTVQVITPTPACPCCGIGSPRIHSTYLRTVADVPIRIKLILKGRSCGIMGLPQPMNQGVSHVDHTPPEPDHANPAHHHH